MPWVSPPPAFRQHSSARAPQPPRMPAHLDPASACCLSPLPACQRTLALSCASRMPEHLCPPRAPPACSLASARPARDTCPWAKCLRTWAAPPHSRAPWPSLLPLTHSSCHTPPRSRTLARPARPSSMPAHLIWPVHAVHRSPLPACLSTSARPAAPCAQALASLHIRAPGCPAHVQPSMPAHLGQAGPARVIALAPPPARATKPCPPPAQSLASAPPPSCLPVTLPLILQSPQLAAAVTVRYPMDD
jgi:hypothetical protein